MERREHYEPEDIEVLLNKRAFDELLPEEQAFVLRHLSGREEYEHMRALLHHLREEERGHGPVIADPGIREQLMRTYREQQVPVWRIWLNSVKAFLLPEQASAFWRPALALATVLILVVGVITWRTSVGGGQELAALEQKDEADKAGTLVTEDHKEVDAFKSTPGTGSDGSGYADVALRTSKELVLPDASAKGDKLAEGLAELKAEWSTSSYSVEQPPAAEEPQLLAGAARVPAQLDQDRAAADTVLFADESKNYVEREDLATNGSVANATGEVTMREVVTAELEKDGRSRRKQAQMEKEAALTQSRSLEQDAQLIDLLKNAW